MKKRRLLLALSCASPDGSDALAPPGGAQPGDLACLAQHLALNTVTGVDDVLERYGFPGRGSDALRTGLVARFIADPSIDGGKYGYPSIHLPGVRSHQVISQGGQVFHAAGEYADWRSIVTMRTLRCPRTTGGAGP